MTGGVGLVVACLLSFGVAIHSRAADRTSFTTAPGVARLAVVVGANQGAGLDGALRYAETDAARMAAVLGEVGRHGSSSIQLLRAPRPAAVLEALVRARQRASVQSRRGKKVLFTFYYSGHADPSDLRFSGGRLPLAELRRRIRRVAADVRLVILDACHSGAYHALARKGGRPAPPFRIHVVDDLHARGEVIITSTSAHERAQESRQIQGSFFTSHLITGLRGAADANRDAKVTLIEAYGYAYDRTLESTVLSHVGLQHPRYQLDLTGSRDIVLTWPGGTGSTLTLLAHTAGAFLVFSGDGRTLHAEVPASPGDERRIALPAGRYLVRKRTASGALSARVRVGRGAAAVIAEPNMSARGYRRTVARGMAADPLLLRGGTATLAGLGVDLRISPIFALGFGGGYVAPGVTLPFDMAGPQSSGYGFSLGAGAGLEVSAGIDHHRWWSVHAGAGYLTGQGDGAARGSTISSWRAFIDARWIPISTPRFRLGVGGGPGLFEAGVRSGSFRRSSWTGGFRAGLLCTVYLWSGFGLGFGYHYLHVNAIERDSADRYLDLGGHQVTLLSLSFRI